LVVKVLQDFRSRSFGALAFCLIGLSVPISSKASSCQFRFAESTPNALVSTSTSCSESELDADSRPLSFTVNHIGRSESWSEEVIEWGSPTIAEFQNVSAWGSAIPYPRAETGTVQPDSLSQPVRNYGARTLIVAVLLIGAIRRFFMSPAYRKVCREVLYPLVYDEIWDPFV
jgi:hypothetical protein